VKPVRIVRRVLVAVLALLLLVPAATSSAAAQGGRTAGGGLGPFGGLVPGLGRGFFVVVCGFSHTNHDDMIVDPGQPGRSHDHTYFGNTSTNASSTLSSLQASGSTCSARGDRAAYWVPTLTLNGNPVQPLGAAIYYVRRTTNSVQPFPPGFRMIAGDATAHTAQSLNVTAWSCGPFSAATTSVPTCRLPALFLRVRFPDCWDGTHLDAADHKSHMAYSTAGTCPASHPVALPGLQLDVLYPTGAGPHTALSSGGQYSSHADFVNAWNQQLLTQRVDQALNHTQSSGPTVV
jgi:hypothetical protein